MVDTTLPECARGGQVFDAESLSRATVDFTGGREKGRVEAIQYGIAARK
jgi:hypothetical protein